MRDESVVEELEREHSIDFQESENSSNDCLIISIIVGAFLIGVVTTLIAVII